MQPKAPFNGSCIVAGGLTNTRVLVADPHISKFKKLNNKWFDFARSLYYLVENHDAKELSREWKYKFDTPTARKFQFHILFSLLSTPDGKFPRNDIIALAAWMLSEMLTEVPVIMIDSNTDRKKIATA